MSNQNKYHSDADYVDRFDELFQEAEEDHAYWVSMAKLNFTEEMLAQMRSKSVNKIELARRLHVKPAQVTRLCSGRNNFTLETMVRVAKALECDFCNHLQPEGTTSHWIDVLKDERPVVSQWENAPTMVTTVSFSNSDQSIGESYNRIASLSIERKYNYASSVA